MIIDYLTIIAGVISVALAAIVLAEGTSTKAMRTTYAMFAGSVGLWAIFLGLFLVINSNDWGRLFVFVYYSLGLLIPYSFLFFSLTYLSIQVSRFVKVFALLPWIIMSAVIAVPGGMVNSVNSSANTVDLVPTAYLVYSAIFLLYVAIGLWFLITKAARAKRKQAHRRIVAVSLLIGFAGGGYFDIILPLFGDYSLIAFGPLFAFVTSAGIFYVIARHGLFDIRQAVIRTMTYVLSLATLAGVYLFVVFIIFNQLLGQSSTINQTVLNVGLTLVLAFIFQPIKKFFDHLTNRLFYKDTYNPDDFYARFNKVLTSTTDLRHLLHRTATVIAETLKAEHVSYIVFVGEKGMITSGTDEYIKVPRADVREFQSYGDTILSIDPKLPHHLAKILKSHRIEIVIPVKKENEIIGFLCLGEHKISRYTRRDLRVLATISDELVIAVQNALSVQEVKDLNASLEQRIDTATKELRISNAQLQRLDEAKDEFISMASHQLRTPLTSIKGYISMLMEGDVGKVSKEQKKLLEEVFTSSERMVRLIGDFLNVSRLQTGKFVLEKQPVNIAELVGREVRSLEQNAASKEIKFSYKEPKKIPLLDIDESKFQQVIMNFADNALYYSKPKSTIKVSVAIVKDRVEVTIKDTGIGVPLAEQENLFNKFFRATNARKQRPDGTGVGLFLAKKVIDAHDGKIIFESKENKGSTFGFSLPIAKLRVRDSN